MINVTGERRTHKLRFFNMFFIFFIFGVLRGGFEPATYGFAKKVEQKKNVKKYKYVLLFYFGGPSSQIRTSDLCISAPLGKKSCKKRL